jgi:hypothetical protein
MRKAQNAMKFGLKLGAFAALAASLSSCLIVVTPSTPTIAFAAAPTYYCDGDGVARTTKMNFTYDLSNIDNATIEAVVTADAVSDVTDPIKEIKPGGKTGTNATTVANSVSQGSGRYSASITLSMDKDNQFVSIQSLNPKLTVTANNVRLWIHAFNKTTETNWAKSPAIAPASNANITCP